MECLLDVHVKIEEQPGSVDGASFYTDRQHRQLLCACDSSQFNSPRTLYYFETNLPFAKAAMMICTY